MPSKLNPKQIVIAREARGMMQKELAEHLPILNQGNLSKYERGLLIPNDNIVNLIAEELKFPISFFYQDDTKQTFSTIYYRKSFHVKGKDLNTLRAKINVITRAVGYLMDNVEMDKPFQRMSFDLDGAWEPKFAARVSREVLEIPTGPIKNLISYIEKAGIIVYYTKFDIEGFDGIATFTENGWPILFVNGNKANDRIRMNLAHELGHVTQHLPFIIDPGRDVEFEAREYASEFLMPSHEIKRDLSNLNYNKLSELKEYWYVSKAALIYKAFSLGIIGRASYKHLNIELSRRGEKKVEDGFVGLDTPNLLKDIISLYKNDLHYSLKDLASITHLTESDFTDIFEEKINKPVLKFIPVV